ncbi:MAG TPA: hypothetical protein VFY76_11765 [Nocardioides sp.]|nr:hypothetical protein [Nocardioides sp.]
MSLDEELRATLGLEAELRTVPPPDVVGLIHGGRVRRRRRRLVRAAMAVAASVAIGAATLGYVALDPRAEGDVVSPPSPSPGPRLETLSEDGRATLEPGTYLMFAGRDPAGVPIEVDVTIDGPDWKHGDFPLLSDRSGSAHAGFGIYQAAALAAGDGCETGPTVAAASRTPTTLAAQLSGLPRSTVLRPPEPARVLGRDAVHLRLRVEVGCPGYYRVAHATGGTRGITYAPVGLPASDVVIDFWVFRAAGAVLVVDEWHDVDAPADVVARARSARRSIRFVEGD